MDELVHALQDAGGPAAPRERSAQLRSLLRATLDDGAHELTLLRSGTDRPVTVAVAAGGRAVAPVDPALRVDPAAAGGRAFALLAALIGALREAGATHLEVGALHGALLLDGGPATEAVLTVLAFEERAARIDRLRARAVEVPAHVLEGPGDLRAAPIATPLRMAWRIAQLGGDPVDPDPATEDVVLAELEASGGAPRPHDDPDPARRIARRILQRLHGMGKWGGYHTNFDHLARGFAGHERALADEVGEALLRSGLLKEKQSVGQRHVFLDPRRAAAIHAFIDRGEAPDGFAV